MGSHFRLENLPSAADYRSQKIGAKSDRILFQFETLTCFLEPTILDLRKGIARRRDKIGTSWYRENYNCHAEYSKILCRNNIKLKPRFSKISFLSANALTKYMTGIHYEVLIKMNDLYLSKIEHKFNRIFVLERISEHVNKNVF